MRRFSGFGRMLQVVVAGLALVVAGGCSSDDDQSTASPSIAGEYEASVPLDGGATAEVEMIVDDDGDASGTVLLPGDAAEAAALSGVAAISVSVDGFTDRETGEFELTGTFAGADGPVVVRLTGVLPGPGRTGSVTLEIGEQFYTAALTAVAVPTPVFTPTLPPGTGPTNTPGGGGNSGVSPAMLGVWSGTARNDSAGTSLTARIRIEESGSNVVVTDLNRNIFPGGDRVTMDVQTANALSYNAFGPPVVVFTLNLTSSTTLVGLHGVTSTSFPPTTTSLALNLSPER